jgi:hypothetical protein
MEVPTGSSGGCATSPESHLLSEGAVCFVDLVWIQQLHTKWDIVFCLLYLFVMQDLQDKPKYLLALTVGLKQKNFVNQCVQKVFSSLQVFCVLMAFVCSGFERQFQCILTFSEVTWFESSCGL